MANVYYRTVSGASVDHLSLFENFLDNNHEEISSALHSDLASIYEEMNDKARDVQSEYESTVEDMQSEIEDLKTRIAELEDAQ